MLTPKLKTEIPVTFKEPLRTDKHLKHKSYKPDLPVDFGIGPKKVPWIACKRLQAAPHRETIVAFHLQDGLLIPLVHDAGNTRITEPSVVLKKRNTLGAAQSFARAR